MDFDKNCIFRPTSLHQIYDFKVICISYILLTVVLYITLEPNGKLSGYFVWLDMGFPSVKKESNTLNASVFTKFGSLLYGDLH